MCQRPFQQAGWDINHSRIPSNWRGISGFKTGYNVFLCHCWFLGAFHGEGSGKWKGPGPQTEDPDVVGGLLFICGQDSPDHTGGELKHCIKSSVPCSSIMATLRSFCSIFPPAAVQPLLRASQQRSDVGLHREHPPSTPSLMEPP